jgi:hypothetical protein
VVELCEKREYFSVKEDSEWKVLTIFLGKSKVITSRQHEIFKSINTILRGLHIMDTREPLQLPELKGMRIRAA